MRRIAILLLCLLATTPALAEADTIFFKDGARLDVGNAWEEEGEVKCVLYGTAVSYPKEEIVKVEKSSSRESASPQPKRKDKEAVEYHSKARSLAKEGSLIEAIEHEERAHRLRPDDPVIAESLIALYRAYAAALQQQGEVELSISYLERASEHDPRNVETKQNLAAAYVSMARDAVREKEYYAGNELLVKAKRYDHESSSLYALSGEIAYLTDNYAQAEEDWTRSLSLQSDQPGLRAHLEKMRQERTAERGMATERRADFQFKFEQERRDDVAEAAIAVLEEAYDKVGNDLALFPDWGIQVIIYPQSGLDKLEYFPDWAAGTYDGKIRFGEDLYEHATFMKAVLFHEYTHVLVRALGGDSVPLWLNEGLAEYEAQPYGRASMRGYRKRLLAKSAKTNKLFSLEQLARINLSRRPVASDDLIQLVYAESESFVRYLMEKQASFTDMRALLVRLRNGESIEDAVRTVLYKELIELEAEWQKTLRDGE